MTDTGNGRRRTTTLLGSAIALIGLILAVAPVAAGGDRYGYGPHTMTPGLHWILDAPGTDQEYPAVVCSYSTTGSYKLRSMLIRQPVLLADVSQGQRTQRVGWRAVIQRRIGTGAWQLYGQTSLSKANATGRVAASFAPRSFTLPSDVGSDARYRVVYRLYWYRANGTTVEDQVSHRPYWYGVKGIGTTWDACPSTYAPVTAAGAPTPTGIGGVGAHSGKRGLHWILDTYGPDPEFKAVTCEYGAEYLEKMRVRRPMVLARDTGPGTDRQDVAWRAVLQYTLENSVKTAWLDGPATEWTRVRASDSTWAAFLPKSLPVDGESEPAAYRVLFQIRWYKGSSNEILGRATHVPIWYGVDQGEFEGTREDYCYASFSG